MNPALETLMLVFAADGGLPVPERALFLGAEPHPALAGWPDLTAWQPLKPKADVCQRAGLPLAVELPDGQWPVVLLLPGKSRDETLAWFALARERLAPGGHLVVAMPNSAGAGRFEKEFAKATGEVVSLQKHKCRAFHAANHGDWNEELFREWRALAEPRLIPDTHFFTQAGIFSSEHVDPGSQLLASHLPASLHGRVADLGAGWGVLSDAALRRCPQIKQLDLFEADSRALACARRNLASYLPAANPLSSPPCLAADESRIGFHWHDVTTGVPDSYDAVLMNPPFHSGQATDVDLGRAFLNVAAGALKRGGKLYLVANRQLPYESLLDSLRFSWRKVAEDATYKLLFADKR